MDSKADRYRSHAIKKNARRIKIKHSPINFHSPFKKANNQKIKSRPKMLGFDSISGDELSSPDSVSRMNKYSSKRSSNVDIKRVAWQNNDDKDYNNQLSAPLNLKRNKKI
jgi:hypothetical protein